MISELNIGAIQTTSACSALYMNAILICLIIKKSPKQLGSYRYLMIYTCLFEISYSIADVAISPIIFSHGTLSLVIVSTSQILPNFIILLLNCFWCGSFGSFMTLFCIQFIYRYYVVTGSKIISTFNDYRILFWILIPILSGAAWGVATYFILAPTMEMDESIRNFIRSKLGKTHKNLNYIGPHYHKTTNGFQIDTAAYITISSMIFLVIFSLFCIMILAFKTFMNVRQVLGVTTMSKLNNRLQSQTFYALLIQTFIPIILMHFPTTLVLLSAMLNIDLGTFNDGTTITVTIFPALDPLPVMLIIQNYRQTIVKVLTEPFRCLIRRKSYTHE